MTLHNRSHNQETDVNQTSYLITAEGSEKEIVSTIIKEHRLDIYVQEQLAFQVVCTPTDLAELVVGRLVSEGIVKAAEEIALLDICEHGNRAKVYLKDDIKFVKSLQREPTCCTGNKQFLQRENVEKETTLLPALWKKEWIFALTKVFAEGSMLHKKTKGTHCCYLAVEDKVLYAAEDIGRHNALDKAIGYAVLQNLPREKCILFTTGRVPTDMISKVITARIPTLVSKAVPTDEAVHMAKTYQMNLICKAWPDSFEVFNSSDFS